MIKIVGKKIIAFLIYLFPAMIAIVGSLSTDYIRMKTAENYLIETNNQVRKSDQSEIKQMIEKNPNSNINKLLQYFLNNISVTEASMHKLISDNLIEMTLTNLIVISLLTLFPFLILGIGIFKYFPENNNRFYIANHQFIAKLLFAYIMRTSFAYLLYPDGVAKSMFNGFLMYADPLYRNTTLPLFFTQITHQVSGMMGVYTFTIGYFFFKYHNKDVFTSNIYFVLLKKSFFIIILASLLYITKIESAQVIIFFIGLTPPLYTSSLLRELNLIPNFKGGEENKVSLSILPGISHYDIIRLEEESLCSINMLANLSKKRINEISSFIPSLRGNFPNWCDISRLISVLGINKYLEIREICPTASEYIKLSKNKDFKKITEKHGIPFPETFTNMLQRLDNSVN